MLVSLHQICSGPDPRENAALVTREIERAADAGVCFASFPEAANLLRADRFDYPKAAPREEDCPVLAAARNLAARHGLTIHLGSLLVQTGDQRIANRTYVIDGTGAVAATYDKIHLFDVTLPPELPFRESDVIAPGSEVVVVDTPLGKTGLSICFDIRFPRLYQALADAGAEVVLIPAAFSPITGPVHWRALLQARAIETSCHVLAAGQCGTHQGTLSSHGHSAIVSPWGEVLAEAGAEPAMLLADLDPGAVAAARARIPTLALARRDLKPAQDPAASRTA